MMNHLFSLLGPYVREGTGLIFTFFETQLCVCLFARKLERRRFFFLRILFFQVLGIALFYGLAIYNTHTATLGSRLLCYLALRLLSGVYHQHLPRKH